MKSQNRILLISYYVVLGFLIVVALWLLSNNRPNNTEEEHSEYVLNSQLDIQIQGDSVIYSGKLPSDNEGNKVLTFYTAHEEVYVYIGEELVYSLTEQEDSIVKTTGYNWNTVNVDRNHTGQSFRIQMTNQYGDKEKTTEIFYGKQYEIQKTLFAKDSLNFIIALVILVVGIVLCFYSLFSERGKAIGGSTMQLGLFSILTGIWEMSDMRITALFINRPVALVCITHLCLMIMATSFTLFLKSIISKVNYVACFIIYFLDFTVCAIRCIAQLTGTYDFRQTLTLTHVMMIVHLVFVLCMIIREYLYHTRNKMMRMNTMACMVLIVSMTADLVAFRVTGRTSIFSLMGLLIYILVMGIFTMNKSRQMSEKEKETEVYRRLAFVDELTGLFNRTAFQRDVEIKPLHATADSTKALPVSVLMFDLNELKKCNDNFGHEYGDAYITMAAREIGKLFDEWGKCYRIGGDEFCAILDTNDEAKLCSLLQQFTRNMKQLNNPPFVVKISSAVGYAVYNPDQDQSLMDTKNRADKEMYEDKKRMKADRI